MSKKIIKGILDNFLGTFTSRYSDHDGYWLFGLLVDELGEMKIDLLSSIEEKSENTPIETVRKIAVEKFRDQMAKAGLALGYVREASVEIKRLDPADGAVNGRRCPGRIFQFTATAVSHSGFGYSRVKSVFVAPHDSDLEQRSTRYFA